MNYPCVIWGGEDEGTRIVAVDEWDFAVEGLEQDAMIDVCWFSISRINGHTGDKILYQVLCSILAEKIVSERQEEHAEFEGREL